MPSFHGKFIWYELLTTDMPAAIAFYKKVVGWGAHEASGDKNGYTLFTAGDVEVAGAMPQPAGASGPPPAWLGYVAVDDVDVYAAAVKEAGGTVHHAPMDIPDVGRIAIVADPHGAVFGLAKFSIPSLVPHNVGPEAIGYTGWRELMAGDLDTEFAFYAGLFRWTKAEAHDMGPMGVYQLFALGGGEAMGGMMTKPPQMPAPPHWGYYFQVDGINAAIGRINEAGGKVVNGPMQVPGGLWVVQGQDPQGAYFALVSPNA